MLVILLSIGLGLLWHGLQIVWVAPVPRQFRGNVPEPADAEQAFQLFWLDQYAWIGIVLAALGVVLLVLAVL